MSREQRTGRFLRPRWRRLKPVAVMAALGLTLAADTTGATQGQSIGAMPTTRSADVRGSGRADVSMLTYNVHGLPWPIAPRRTAALAAIGRHLLDLHRQGKAPRVAVLQEAFTAEAKAIARTSGYRYAAFGRDKAGRYPAPLPAGVTAASLDAGAHWWKGEGVGKWTGSGLVILSDYPIVDVRQLTYSASACAGYDCLAAKGAMLATLKLPAGALLEIATTHLNSRHATGVDDERANRGWMVQIAELRDFIASRRNAALPLLLGGDLNVGGDIVRRLGLADFAAALGGGARDGMQVLKAGGASLDQDTVRAVEHGKDWELILDGAAGKLTPERAWTPFGANGGAPLSDHLGFALAYAVGASMSKHAPAASRQRFSFRNT